jgi:N-acetylated-alpha-linked acidic dipeptidase
MVEEVAEQVTDPQTNVSIKERKMARDLVNGGNDKFELYALGSGSDYTPFIQHAGIASLNLGFGGENSGGEYHTIYDTYTHYKRFKDPELAYGVALANTAGRIVLRLSNADVLPFEFAPWLTTVSNYLEEIMKHTTEMRNAVQKHNELLEKNAFKLAADPREAFKNPPEKDPVPFLDFSPLQNQLAALKNSIETFSSKDFAGLSKEKREQLNGHLMKAEQALTDDSGLPRRGWYKHQIYAPGFYTGYGVKTLPAVREAIEQENWEEAQEQIKTLANTLERFNAHIREMNLVSS